MEVVLSEIQQKLMNKLRPSQWADKLKGFILSDDFMQILNTLYVSSQNGEKFTPPLKYIFRAFEECPYNELKVVFIGMDPYPQINVADGISFSCSLTGKEQPSLRYIFNEIEANFETSETYKRDPDLKRWSNQGILMLNAALTCRLNTPGSHLNLWAPFTAYLIDILNANNPGLIFVLLGKDAQKFDALINHNHYVIKVVHPAAAAYNGGKWDSQGLFKYIDDTLLKNNNLKIEW